MADNRDNFFTDWCASAAMAFSFCSKTASPGSAVQNNSAAARTTSAKASLLVTRWPERLKPRPDTMQNGLAQLRPRADKTQNKELSASIYLDAPGDELAIAAVEVPVFRRVMIFLPAPGNGTETCS